MRSQYINDLSKNIQLYKEKCEYLRYNKDEMAHSIENGYGKIPEKSDNSFYIVDYNDPKFEDYFIESCELMYINLFYSDLYLYNPNNLPFIVTRYISKLEKTLQKTIIDFLILDKHNKALDKQLTGLYKIIL